MHSVFLITTTLYPNYFSSKNILPGQEIFLLYGFAISYYPLISPRKESMCLNFTFIQFQEGHIALIMMKFQAPLTDLSLKQTDTIHLPF